MSSSFSGRNSNPRGGGSSRGDRGSRSSRGGRGSSVTAQPPSSSSSSAPGWPDRDRPALAASSWRSSSSSASGPAPASADSSFPALGRPASSSVSATTPQASWASTIRGSHARKAAADAEAVAATAASPSAAEAASDSPSSSAPAPAAAPAVAKKSAWANGPPASVTSPTPAASAKPSAAAAAAAARSRSPPASRPAAAAAPVPGQLTSAIAAVNAAAAQPVMSWADQDSDDEGDDDAAPQWAKDLSALPTAPKPPTAKKEAPRAATKSPPVVAGGPAGFSQAMQGFLSAAAAARDGEADPGVGPSSEAGGDAAGDAGHAHVGGMGRFSPREAELVLKKRVEMARDDEQVGERYVPPAAASNKKGSGRGRSASPAKREEAARVGKMVGGRVGFLSELRRAMRDVQQ